jgi:hypothetical protein
MTSACSKARYGRECQSVCSLSIRPPSLVSLLTNSLVAILIGFLLMMWPILTKVQYERLSIIFSTRCFGEPLIPLIPVTWVVAPYFMFIIAWATMPEKRWSIERQGVMFVGFARCLGKYLVSLGVHELSGSILFTCSYGTHFLRTQRRRRRRRRVCNRLVCQLSASG